MQGDWSFGLEIYPCMWLSRVNLEIVQPDTL
jgi:hypothetical protein